MIYPNAIHTRFEHSIGTYHLSKELCIKLNNNTCEIEMNNYLKIMQNYFLIELCQKAELVEKEIWEI